MPDIESKIQAIKLSWMKKLIDKNNNYVNIAKTLSHVEDFSIFFSHNNDLSYASIQPSDFYRQIFSYWHRFKPQPNTPNEILNEKIMHNKNILIGNDTVNIRSIKNNHIEIIYDLLNTDYTIKSRDELIRQGVNITQLEYNSLISAIPKKWLQSIKEYSSDFVKTNDTTIMIDKNEKPISAIKCKEFYRSIVKNKRERATCLYKWEEQYFFVNFDWDEIFINPYKNCRETTIQSLQYQIIHRYFPCQENLNTWYNTNHLCSTCSNIDTIEHFFLLLHTCEKAMDGFYDMVWKPV